ncbi:MAG: hypothetical protein J6U37_05700 [Lachnospiraceae bacterium]|nr:hypothetical protein [Lachnospiraceae bacterium]
MNSIELDVEMKRHGDTGGTLSKALGISQSTFSLKRSGKAEFTQREMSVIVTRYNLSGERLLEIFFTEELS